VNGLDYGIIALIAIGAIHGLSQGALRMLTSVLGLFGGIYFASLYYPRAGILFEREFGLSPVAGSVVGYLALFAIVFFIVHLGGTALMRLLQIVQMNWVDRLAGGALGGAVTGVAAGLLVMLLTAVLPRDAQVLRTSQLAGRLLVYNRALVNYIPPEVKEAYETKRADLMHYWLENEARLAESAASPRATSSSRVAR
jgi:membrane protein required for colicin V production